MTSALFGRTRDGIGVQAIELARGGVSATVLTYGATLQSYCIPDRAGTLADIVLGYADIASYEGNPGYFGATIGRVANRIAGGRFELDGKRYQLECNFAGTASLHGGSDGFDKRVWEIASLNGSSVLLQLHSADGDQGYPGALDVSVSYSVGDDGSLIIDHRATTDRATLVNLTNHSLFNLAGEGSSCDAMGNLLTLHADAYTPVDTGLIPTGAIEEVTGTAFDFRKPVAIGERIRDAADAQLRLTRGYDHNFVLNAAEGLRPVARIEDPTSGRALELSSDQPGMQLYTGNNLNGTAIGKRGRAYRQGDGVALEPQHFPDSPNQPGFPSIRLNPGDRYRNVLVLRPAIG